MGHYESIQFLDIEMIDSAEEEVDSILVRPCHHVDARPSIHKPGLQRITIFGSKLEKETISMGSLNTMKLDGHVKVCPRDRRLYCVRRRVMKQLECQDSKNEFDRKLFNEAGNARGATSLVGEPV